MFLQDARLIAQRVPHDNNRHTWHGRVRSPTLQAENVAGLRRVFHPLNRSMDAQPKIQREIRLNRSQFGRLYFDPIQPKISKSSESPHSPLSCGHTAAYQESRAHLGPDQHGVDQEGQDDGQDLRQDAREAHLSYHLYEGGR